MEKIPRPSKESEAFLRSLLLEGKGITMRPMFGNLAAFTAGNLSVGLYGDDLFVRLSGPDRGELLTNEGASIFEPMKGRQMKEYVVVPKKWGTDPSKIKPWVARSLAWSAQLPAKAKKR
jgi:TfoX/Sxy family transcriptional regulator of competence genes